MAYNHSPHEQYKQAGLEGLKELSEMTEQSKQTLINWHRNKYKLFVCVVAGAAAIKQHYNGG